MTTKTQTQKTESKIIEYTLELKLPAIRKNFKEIYNSGTENNHLEFLLKLLA